MYSVHHVFQYTPSRICATIASSIPCRCFGSMHSRSNIEKAPMKLSNQHKLEHESWVTTYKSEAGLLSRYP